MQLAELESVIQEVRAQWPRPLEETVTGDEHSPALGLLVRKRDLLSDSVKIFSAMAVEAFLNYYGVVRLGEAEYAVNFERLPLIPKLRTLLLVCDSLSITESDPLIKLLKSISERRNSLLHPKAHESPHYVQAEDREGDKIPEVARHAVREMDDFFREFVTAVPKSAHLVPRTPVRADEAPRATDPTRRTTPEP